MTDVLGASSARRRTVVRRALVLAGLGAGFWLLGHTDASADEPLPSALTGEVLAAVGSGTPESVSAVPSTAIDVVSPVPVPAPPAVVAPPADVATGPAGGLRPVQQATHLVPDAIAHLADPAERIVAVADTAVDVIEPVVEATARADEPLGLDPVLDLVRGLLGEVADESPDGLPSVDPPAASAPTVTTVVAVARVTEEISKLSVDGLSTQGAAGSGPSRDPADRSEPDAPPPPSGSPASAPSRTACADPPSLDQTAAHPPAVAASRGASACGTAAGPDEAAGGLPLDPSSSPD